MHCRRQSPEAFADNSRKLPDRHSQKMKTPPKPVNEKLRIEALRSYKILDTLPEKEYDDITRIASEICGTPISLLSFIDNDRQWFKSNIGLDATETHRDLAFCAHAIHTPDELMEVVDARKDERFYNNPLVKDHPGIVFYAGVPLVDSNGCALGTLCVIDQKPRVLSPTQKSSLRALADQIMRLLDLRLAFAKLEQREKALQNRFNELEKFTYVVSHDLKSPLNNILCLSDLLRESSDVLGTENSNHLGMIHESAETLRGLIDGILKYYKSEQIFSDQLEQFDVKKLLNKVVNLYRGADQIEFTIEAGADNIFTHKIALKQILINLIGNSLKYNDKPVIKVDISMTETKDYYIFQVTDNGRGIALKDQKRIFDLFTTLDDKDRKNQPGSGIGLATVKKLVNQLGGEIHIHSELQEGSRFEFTLKKATGAGVIPPLQYIEQHMRL